MWNEPSDWGGATPISMKKGVGYTMDDDYLGEKPYFVLVSHTDMSDATAPGCDWIVDPPDKPVIPSQGMMWVKIRTQYQNGSVDYDNGGDPIRADS